MTIENFENLNTPTESKIANTTVKTFKDLTIDLNKLVSGATNNIERTHKILINALRFMHLKQVKVDEFINLMNTVVAIPYVYQPTKIILFIEKFSFLIWDLELKSFKLRKANNTTISVKTVQDANSLAAPFLTGGRKLTEQDIISNNVPEELKDNAVFQEMRYKVMTTKKQVVIQQERLKRAYEENNITDESKLNQKFGKYTGQELLDRARQVLNDPSITLIDLINIRDDIGDIYGEESFFETVNPLRTSTKIDPRILQDPSHPDHNRYKRALAVQNMFGDKSDSFAALRSLNALTDAGKEDKKKIDRWLKENSTLTKGTFASNNMPGITPQDVTKNTKYVKEFFKSTPLDKTFNIYWDGEQQRGIGTVSEMVKDLGWSSEEIQVKNVLFHTTPAFGEPTLQLTVVGKDKNNKNVSKEIILPYSNIRNKQMDQYFNSPGYLLQMEMNLHKHTGAPSADMAIYGPDGKETGSATFSFSGASDKVTLFDPTKGRDVTYRVDSPQFVTFVNDAAKLGYEIRTKL